jgi:electron transfer flavoprotein beta subunit
MKILVSVKRVPDPDEPIRLRPDSQGIVDAGISYVLNPFDAIALEEALRIRERQDPACEVLAVSIGSVEWESELRTALAMGADRALLVRCDEPLDPWSVAQVLSAIVHREQPDLVFMGKQAVDDDCNQTGQMLAGLLGWPQATFASRIEFLADGESLKVARETDLGLETIRVRLPAVITADLRLNEPRYAPLPALMKSRKRPIEAVSLQDVDASIEPRVRIVRWEQAAVERTPILVADVSELVQRLRCEAKVI